MRFLAVFILFFSLNVHAQTKDEAARILNNKNHYTILDVKSDATAAEIKKAYRKLMSTYHPDRYMDNETKRKAATEVMKKLNESYEVLGDELKRKSYDITVRATSTMKAASATSTKGPTPGPAPKSKPATGAWQKHQFTDFDAEAKAKAAEAEKAKASASAETPKDNTYSRPKPNAQASAEPKPEPKSQPQAKTSTAEPVKTSSSSSVTPKENAPISLKAQKAQKMYQENCGAGSFYDSVVNTINERI